MFPRYGDLTRIVFEGAVNEAFGVRFRIDEKIGSFQDPPVAVDEARMKIVWHFNTKLRPTVTDPDSQERYALSNTLFNLKTWKGA